MMDMDGVAVAGTVADESEDVGFDDGKDNLVVGCKVNDDELLDEDEDEEFAGNETDDADY